MKTLPTMTFEFPLPSISLGFSGGSHDIASSVAMGDLHRVPPTLTSTSCITWLTCRKFPYVTLELTHYSKYYQWNKVMIKDTVLVDIINCQTVIAFLCLLHLMLFSTVFHIPNTPHNLYIPIPLGVTQWLYSLTKAGNILHFNHQWRTSLLPALLHEVWLLILTDFYQSINKSVYIPLLTSSVIQLLQISVYQTCVI